MKKQSCCFSATRSGSVLSPMQMCTAADAEVGLRPHGKVLKISSVSAFFVFFFNGKVSFMTISGK